MSAQSLRLLSRNRTEFDYGETLDLLVSILKRGGIIALPTDTVWGLATLASNATGIERIQVAKGRPESQPIVCLISSTSHALRLSLNWPEPARVLTSLHWPGPLTLIVKTADCPYPHLTGGRRTLGLRWPRDPVLQDILEALDEPLAATSANLSGAPPLTSEASIRSVFSSILDVILVTDTPSVGEASTVVEVNESGIKVLRTGPLRLDFPR